MRRGHHILTSWKVNLSGGSEETGSGADIWNTADAFRFVHREWPGDGSIATLVNFLDNTHVWAKAGVMFRETLSPGSKHVMLVETPGKGLAMQYRPTTAASASTSPSRPGQSPSGSG